MNFPQAFAWLTDALLTGPQTQALRLVAVDGRAGSGKSTFARALSRALGGVNVLQLDDFLAWDDLTEFWPRFEAEVLLPLETPPAVCLQRGISRDGVERKSLWMTWQERESAFFEADPVRNYVHLIVDGQQALGE
jgi:thymidylate kinase